MTFGELRSPEGVFQCGQMKAKTPRFSKSSVRINWPSLHSNMSSLISLESYLSQVISCECHQKRITSDVSVEPSVSFQNSSSYPTRLCKISSRGTHELRMSYHEPSSRILNEIIFLSNVGLETLEFSLDFHECSLEFHGSCEILRTPSEILTRI